MSADSNTTLPGPTGALMGLGTMGAGIAERLLDQGFAVDVWNRTPGPEARLTERGATAHVMPEQAAARASVVLTMLPTGDAVAEVMLERSALNAMRSGAVWAQMGTIGVESTDTLRSEVARARPDVAFVYSPVSGGREPARSCRLVILASGPVGARSTVEPVFEALGRPVWLGESGAGSPMKLWLNTLRAFE